MIRTTGIGGLPHLDPTDAAAFVDRTADVPYLPQLPRRHPEEGMLLQWGDGLCGCGAGGGLGLEYGAPTGPRHEAFVGALGYLDELEAAPPLLKVQATGPVTLGLAMRAGGHPGDDALWSCVVEGLCDRIEDHLRRVARRLPDTELLVVLDEPALGAGPAIGGLGPARDALAAVLDRIHPRPGIHCCGDAPWSELAGLSPAAVSFDVGSVGRAFAGSVDALAEVLSAGTRMIWGAVPVDAPPLPPLEHLVSRIRRVEGALVMAGADLAALGDAWVSPACGLAGLTPDHASAVARRTAEVAEELH
ncbi:MAG: hypothetical protein R3290_13655 [Acidimicrobiia bacterium]|nr:hypothetical protein [Acidimicrobiia bacterium]